MSLSLTFWTFRHAQCMMSQENKGGRSMRGTRTARIELSKDPVDKGVTVPGKKVTFIGGGGLDLGNIVSSNRRGKGSRAPIVKPPKGGKKVGKIASASSGNKRGREGAAASPGGAVATAVASSPMGGQCWSRPPHTTKFLREVSVGMKEGHLYTLTQLAKGLGLPPFVSSTKAELEKYLLSQHHAATQNEPFDPTIVVEALGEAFDEHFARSGKNLQSPAPSPASSSSPMVYLPHSFLPFFHSLHSSFIFLPSFRLSFILSLLPSFGHYPLLIQSFLSFPLAPCSRRFKSVHDTFRHGSLEGTGFERLRWALQRRPHGSRVTLVFPR